MSVRSGTNFIGKLISYHPDFETLPPGMTKAEFAFFRGKKENELISFFENFKHYSFADFKTSNEDFKKEFSKWFLDFLLSRHEVQKPYIFIKEPHIQVEHFFEWFPDKKVIMIIRDGRDQVSSFARASNFHKKSYGLSKIARMTLKYYSGYSFYQGCHYFKKNARQFIKNTRKWSDEKYLVIRFEHLENQTAEEIKRVFHFWGVEIDENTIHAMENCEIIGSSFTPKSEYRNRWKPRQKSHSFQPVGRWKNWNVLKKITFKLIAGKELILLGYEKDNSW
ncbi:MAG TPA: hypothetical protein DDX92_06510 [Flavobacteriales bacterium]|nr:hypothetical protein [Flavobacteriales bacterium]